MNEEELKKIKDRLATIETFLSSLCALQLIHQGLITATPEEVNNLQTFMAETLENWKRN